MRLYIACLASYNNGVLHGKWIDASSDVDEMQAEIATVLLTSRYPNVTLTCKPCSGAGETPKGFGYGSTICPTCRGTGRRNSAEERAVHDYDDFPDMGEYPSLKDVAAYVEWTEESELDADTLKALLDNHCGNVEYAKEQAENYCGTYANFREYSDERADEMLQAAGGDETTSPLTQELINYFDYESYARDQRGNMTVLYVPSGVALFHG